MMGTGERKDRLRRTLNSVLGLELLSYPGQQQDQADADDAVDLEEP